MWTKIIILTLFAVSALLVAVIGFGMKTTDLDDVPDTLSAGNYLADHKAVSLRGRRALALNVKNDEFSIADRTDASQPKVSYVTSFWAQEKGTEVHPHRIEIRAALLAIILNPHFDQVVIFLDGVKETANCDLFLKGIIQLSRTLDITSFPIGSDNHVDLFSKVTCVDSPNGQPNYYQMFQNAVSDYVTGDIVVMANADQAFDTTMKYARHLNPEVLISLGTRGYDNNLTPPEADYFYKQIVGKFHPQYLHPKNEAVKTPDNCMNIPGSIDTWIFHKNKLKGTLKPEPFQRMNNGRMEFFFMNVMQAENAAIWAINQCYEFHSYYNACEYINSWHFHLTPKTHQRGGRVSPPWNHPYPSKRPKCGQEGNCFLRNP